MARRILTSMYACGLAGDRPPQTAFDPDAAEETARKIEQEGAVLLRNDGLLPFPAGLRRVLVVGRSRNWPLPPAPFLTSCCVVSASGTTRTLVVPAQPV